MNRKLRFILQSLCSIPNPYQISDSSGQIVESTFLEAVKNTPEGETIRLLTDIYITSGIAISKSVFITSDNPNTPCMIKNNAPDINHGKETGRIFTVERAQQQLIYIILNGNENKEFDVTLPIALTGPLTDGVRLSMSSWVRPDDDKHPKRDMIVPSGDMAQSSVKYLITQDGMNKRIITRKIKFIPITTQLPPTEYR